jgi:hypothetical protein
MMPWRPRPWHLALLAMAVAGLAVAAAYWLRVRSIATAAHLMSRLPPVDAPVVYVDLRAVRAAGLLPLVARTDSAPEADYMDFVKQTGFDYARDLDAALIAFVDGEILALLQGRFDWGRLVRLVNGRGGDCYNGFCRLRTGAPNRWISFFAVTPSIMGLGVSRDPWAASGLLDERRPAALPPPPPDPVWLTLSGAALERAAWLPAGTRAFVSPMASAERVTLALRAAGGGYEALLEVRCRSAEQAARLAQHLTEITEMLRRLIRLENKAPNPRDLSGILTGGSFSSQGERVEGRWPVPQEFFQALASGSE